MLIFLDSGPFHLTLSSSFWLENIFTSPPGDFYLPRMFSVFEKNRFNSSKLPFHWSLFPRKIRLLFISFDVTFSWEWLSNLGGNFNEDVGLVNSWPSAILNHALRWLNTMEPKGRLTWWLMALQEFEFSVQHRPGKSHCNAHALSRLVNNPCNETNETLTTYAASTVFTALKAKAYRLLQRNL